MTKRASEVSRSPVESDAKIVFMDPENLSPGKNPRRSVSKEGIQELAESIRQFGVLSPVLVYKDSESGTYVVIAGHRRVQASKLAELPVPVIVLKGDSQNRAELSLVENIQREDLSPIDEAEAMKSISKSRRLDARGLAEIFGKSTGYVYRRLRLLELSDKARSFLKDGEISISVAVIILRLSDGQSRDRALTEILQRSSGHDPKEASEIVQRFMTTLSKAPWDLTDPKLVVKAGACSNCPKRSSAQILLFDTKDKTDRCLNAKCFQLKTRTWEKLEIQTLEKAGAKIVSSIKGMSKNWNGELQLQGSKTVLLSDICDLDRNSRKWGEVLGKIKPELLIVIQPKWGGTYKAIARKDAAAILKKKGIKPSSIARQGRTETEKKNMEDAKAWEIAIAKGIGILTDRIRRGTKAFSDKKALTIFCELAVQMVGHEGLKRLAESRGLEPSKNSWGGKDWEPTVRKHLTSISGKHRAASAIELLLGDPRVNGWNSETQAANLKKFGTDVTPIHKRTLARLRGNRKEREAKKAKQSKKSKSKKAEGSKRKK